MANIDCYTQRVTEITINDKKVYIYLNIGSGVSMFITNDAMFETMTFKKSNPTTYDKTAKAILPDDRFIYINEITSYLSTSTVVLYYDKKYQDILIVPSLSFAVNALGNNPYEVNCYTIGNHLTYGNDKSAVYPFTAVDQNNSCKLPETKSEVTTVEYYLASAPGLAAPDVGPDANTYEEMLNDAINLKRYYKQVMSFIKLGTYKDLFKDPKMSNIPLALLRNHGIRIFCYDNIGSNKPLEDQNIYISIPF